MGKEISSLLGKQFWILKHDLEEQNESIVADAPDGSSRQQFEKFDLEPKLNLQTPAISCAF